MSSKIAKTVEKTQNFFLDGHNILQKKRALSLFLFRPTVI